ncbi:MAG: LacI family transcriptional regulator [Clostridiales bacterium]|jgi:LacI family transcriptional regulator|nr:LacI family transcriptional regulator [Clostridiales bacterium]MDN5298556.1 LacI family transcriptional regulator [Clostridiales bacterium]
MSTDKKTTIREVARFANVSIGTVDRVLNNRGNVSLEKEKAVKEAVIKLQYEPNRVAQSLAKQRRKVKIGITFPDVERYFWDKVKDGIDRAEKELQPLGVEFIVHTTSSYNIDEQVHALESLKNQGVHGICMVPHHFQKLDSTINAYEAAGIPIITFISDSPESHRLAYMGVDDVKSGETAAKLMGLYLKGKGKILIFAIHREVLCIDERIKGFLHKLHTEFPEIEVMNVYDVSGGNHLYDYENYQDDVQHLTERLLLEYEDLQGIYVTNSLTNYVGRAALSLGFQDKLAIIGHETTEDTRHLMATNTIDALVCQTPDIEVYYAAKQMYEYITDPTKPLNLKFKRRSTILINELL